MGRTARVFCMAAGACLAAAASAGAGQEAVSLRSLLGEMVDRDALARLPQPPYVCRQASSYERASKTPDDPAGWFANHDWSHFIRDEDHAGRNERVLMEADGPGAVVRMWNGGPKPKFKYRFYLDGSDRPALETDIYAFMTSRGIVPRPLSIENAHGAGGAGGMNSALPIPYARHCKITYDGADRFWYNVEYRTYPAGTPVETFTMAAFEEARPAIERTARTLAGPHAPAEGRRASLRRTVAPGAAETVALPPGPAAVRLLEVRLDARGLEQALRSTVLVAAFDGEAAVWCPVGDFFGSGVGLNPYEDWQRTVAKDGTMTCRWVMPYETSAQLGIANLGKEPVTVALSAMTGPWAWDGRSMHFHANWRHEYPIKTRPYSDWNYIEIRGQGVYMGDMLAVMNPVRNWWGEGDEKIWVDGGPFPSHFGTGTEDYYNYSYGNTTLFQGPFAAQARCDGPGNLGHTTVTRTRSLDRIPFAKSLKTDMEVWHWTPCEVAYAATAYWYARPGATSNRGPLAEEAARPIPQPPRPKTIAGAVECEAMDIVAQSPGIKVGRQNLDPAEWSGAAHLFVQAKQIGDFLEVRFPGPAAGRFKVTLYATKSYDYGVLRFSVNGKPAGPDVDTYAPKPLPPVPIDLGTFETTGGAATLRAEVVGKNPKSQRTGTYFGLDCVVASPAF